MAVYYAFGKIITNRLTLALDAADPTSYTGTGTTWRSIVDNSTTGTLVSCSYSSDFKGGIVFSTPTSSVLLTESIANYGTSSFTVELAFRPTQIQGTHYLISKNSGSFPNWGVYLSGSNGAGKLWVEYRLSSTISCSVSSSTTFVTSSNYLIDAVFSPEERQTYINVDGIYENMSTLISQTGSLSTTSSLFIGNSTVSSSQAYSGSIFNIKIYSNFNSGNTNYRVISQRIQKPPLVRPSTVLALIVGGGGAGITNPTAFYWELASGGGGGGVVYSMLPISASTYNVIVGAGATTGNTSGSNSVFGNIVAFGGGSGAGYNASPSSGGSGAGGRGNGNNPGASGVLNQGFPGGSGSAFTRNSGGGGGGGAGARGSNAGNSLGGNGGDGFLCSILGTPTFYGGGGGGAVAVDGTGTPGRGGRGGGGNGNGGLGAVVDGRGQNGTPNTGGGGGGGENSILGNTIGGSGIVIIRYPGPPIATGGTITSVDGDTIHTFTATGSSTFTVF
jgi:hypothetical protein